MSYVRKIGDTAALGLYGLWQIAYWLLSGRTHPGFDGLWRHRFELSRIWWSSAPSVEWGQGSR